MLGWLFLVLVITVILGFVIMVRCRDEQVGIALAATAIVILSFVAAIFVGGSCIGNVDVRAGLNEGSTYLVKSVTYDYNKVTLGLREINVATNKMAGPEFLHVRTVPRMSSAIVAGDIIIYQKGEIGHWVSPF